MPTTVIEVPVQLKSAIETLVVACSRSCRKAEENRRLDCLAIEAELREAAAQCERGTLAMVVAAADLDAAQILAEGRNLLRVGRFETSYRTAAGPVSVERTLYRETRDRPTTDP